MKIRADVNIDIQRRLKQVRNEKYWTFVGNEWWKLYYSWIPKKSRQTARSVKITGYYKHAEIEHFAPQARYQYYGKLMVDAVTGSSYARKGTKKVLASPTVYLKYSSKKAEKERDKAAWPTQGKKLTNAAQNYVDSGRLGLNG